MDVLKFKDYTELGNYMYEISLQGESITSVLFYNDVNNLLRWLLEYEEIDIGDIQIIEEYEAEYYLTLDNYLRLNIKPAINGHDEIVSENTDYMLLNGEVSNKIALHNKDCEKYEILFTQDKNLCGECCADCTNCPRKGVIETLNSTLELFDYILNHQND